MRKSLCIFVAGLGLALSAWVALRADPPTPRTTGRVLLLDNDRAVEGDIQREGNQYRIRREIGEVWIPADKAQRLCADWNEAFTVLSSQANPYDADEHMRLARWCQLHNLREQAVGEVQTALKMRPNWGE